MALNVSETLMKSPTIIRLMNELMGLLIGFLLMCAAFQLVRRIYKGIPLQLRGEVWCLLLDIPKIKEEKKDFYEV